MTGPIPDQAEFDAWKQRKSQDGIPDAAEFAAWKARKLPQHRGSNVASAPPPERPLAGYSKLADFGKALPRTLETALTQGVALGFGDEASSFGQAAGERVGGHTPDLWKRYDELQAIEEAKQATFAKEHPALNAGATVAGGLALGLAAGAKSAVPAVARSLGKRTAIGLGEGAVLGGVQGAGMAGQGNRIEGAVTGSVVGGAVGAVLPSAIDIGSKIVHSAARLGQRGATALMGETVPATNAAEERAKDVILSRLGKPIAEAQTEAAQAGASPLAITELSPGVRKLGDLVAQTPTKGAEALDAFTRQRNYGAPSRVRGALEEGFAMPRQYAEQALDEIAEAQATAAAPAYQKAFAHGVVNDPEVVTRYTKLKTLFPKAEKAARKTAEALEIPPKQLMVGDQPTVEYLHLFKQEVDKLVQVAKRSNESGVAASGPRLAGLAKQQGGFVKALKRAVPDYGKAAEEFAGSVATMDAAEAGIGVLRMRPEQVTRTLHGMGSQAERDAFRRTALDALSHRAGETSYGGNIKLALDRNQNDADLLQALFPTPESYQAFAKTLGREDAMARTFQMFTGNSATARRLFEGEGGTIGEAAHAGIAFGWRAALKRAAVNPLLRRLQGVTPEVADALGVELTKTGGSLQALLEELAKREASRAGTQQAGQTAGRVAAQYIGGQSARP